LVGDATIDLETRQDFFVSVKTPAYARQGDELQILARVHNLTDYVGPVEVTLELAAQPSVAGASNAQTRTIQVAANSTADCLFSAWTLPDVRQLRANVAAKADGHDDAVQVELPIAPWGLEFADHKSGRADGDVDLKLELPSDRPFGSRWLDLWIGPTQQQEILDLALQNVQPLARGNQSFRAPPGCWERSPASDLLATVAAWEFAEASNAPAIDRQRLAAQARQLASSLVVSQRKDGSWSWQPTLRDGDWGVSALAFWALTAANKQGVALHDDVLPKAQSYLENQFTKFGQDDNDPKAVVLHALSRRDAADFAHVNRLYRQRQSLGATALAYAALTMANLDRPDFAKEMLETLAAKPRAPQSDPFAGSKDHDWLGDSIETAAIAALAWQRVDATSPHADEAIKYLMARRRIDGFAPAKSHGPAVAALCSYYQHAQHVDDDYRLAIEINGKPLAELSADGAAEARRWSVPRELLTEGRNEVKIRFVGKGSFSYAAELRGFSPKIDTPDRNSPQFWPYADVAARHFRHAALLYKGRPIGPGSTSPLKHAGLGQRVHVDVDVRLYRQCNSYAIVEEPIPAGMTVVEGSLAGRFEHVETLPDRLVMYFRPGNHIQSYRYDLAAQTPGVYRAPPTVMRDALDPSRRSVGPANVITILGPGLVSDDPYEWNSPERFALARLLFDDGDYAGAAPHLQHLFQHDRAYEDREVARMLLWIYATPDMYDAQHIVDAFEVLRERHPDLEIPYDKIMRVGQAYHDINEQERAMQIYRAIVEASFVNDSHVSAILDDSRQFAASYAYQRNLCRQYPDSESVIAAYFALSQAIYQQSSQVGDQPDAPSRVDLTKLPLLAGSGDLTRRLTKATLLRDAIDDLSQFLTLYPENPLADDAGFSMANALLALKQYELVVEMSQQYRKRFLESPFADGFQYMTALGYFWQHMHDEAIEAAGVVARGDGKDRDLATYIIGQIHHARNEAAQAIEWYRKVAEKYDDARQAIEYFERQAIHVEEVTVFRPGEKPQLKVAHRNVRELKCQVYRVDLMRLYLREKNLSHVADINLAGIAPLVDKTLALGDGKDYADRETVIELDLPEEGAYLAICRGDDLFASGLALVTPLEIKIQEDVDAGQVRANVVDVATGQYVPEVHVKAIGSEESQFHDGETDLRGVFVADGLQGAATVIARQGESRYAFYRGAQRLGPPQDAPASQVPAEPSDGPQRKATDFESNLRLMNESIQEGNYIKFDQFRRGQNRGVRVRSAR
ncbi:MAG: hypothetical protein KDA61_18560, partial [Planctomycetales bacterium]|nr:hypothetical protein [Planctomycetales bacterium]